MKYCIVTGVIILLHIACSPIQQKNIENRGQEQYRPKVHFTPPSQWMNDPNGMVYYDGEYHLFYQHYPDSTIWGPMHWGHAVSRDLIHWEHLPIALYPDSLGYIFSGSAVMDTANTSGLGTREQPAMVAVFTYHHPEGEKAGRNDFQYQGIAYSLDKGRNWTKFKNNPVLKNPGIRDFRDPKVSWNRQTQKWIMVLAAGNKVMFYSSPNLIDWTFESGFGESIGAHGGVWECPDIFPMQVENETKWILLVSINPGGPNGGSATQYFVGDFDGHKFTPTRQTHKWIDYGKDNYAGVTWSNVPDQRTLFIGWMSNWQYANTVPTQSWRSAATISRELSLVNENNEYWLVSLPVREFNSLKGSSVSLHTGLISGEKEFSDFGLLPNIPCEINITFQLSKEKMPENFGIIISNKNNEFIRINYETGKNQVQFDRSFSGKTDFSKEFPGTFYAPCIVNNKLQMQLILDVASLEIFAQNGRTLILPIL